MNEPISTATPPPEEPMVAAVERMRDIYRFCSYDEVARFVLDTAQELIPSEAASCMLVSTKADGLHIIAASGPDADLLEGQTLSMNRGVAAFAVNNGSVVAVSAPEDDPRFDKEVDRRTGFTTRNLLCAPLKYDKEILGVVELLNSPEKRGFTRENANILVFLATTFSEYAATALPLGQDAFTDESFVESQSPLGG